MPGSASYSASNATQRTFRAAGELALESRFQAVRRTFHRKTGGGERVAQQTARVVFVEGELRMRVDVVRYFQQLLGERIDPVRDDLFQFGGHGNTPTAAGKGPAP